MVRLLGLSWDLWNQMFIKAKIVFSFQLEGQPNRKGGRLRTKSYAILFEIRKSLERSKVCVCMLRCTIGLQSKKSAKKTGGTVCLKVRLKGLNQHLFFLKETIDFIQPGWWCKLFFFALFFHICLLRRYHIWIITSCSW